MGAEEVVVASARGSEGPAGGGGGDLGVGRGSGMQPPSLLLPLLLLLCQPVFRTRGESRGGKRPGDPPSLGGSPVGGGQRAKVLALRQHWMEKILAPKMGQSAGRPNSAPAATQTKAVGLVPGVVTAGGWVRGCPPPGRTK